MTQFKIGLMLYIVLLLPPVADLLESIMIIHMHMQMPLLVVAGVLMAQWFQERFSSFFQTWNPNGIPGILLFIIISLYWTIPRTMDEALTLQSVALFKYISLPFLAGIPLRDSWSKLSLVAKKVTFIFFTLLFLGMGWLYIYSPVQLCNNYLLVEQITLGWGFLTTGICMVVYILYVVIIDPAEYE